GCHLDLDFAKRELSTTHPSPKELATVERIQETVCNHFHVSPDDMLSKARQKSISRARHIAMFLCRQRLKCSFPEIGRAFANRDHSTVMSAVRKVETMRDQDPELRSHIDEIERRLSASGR
ncbi:MAG: chromosomal replication initiator protein DnaA, partial [Polyangiaceae bacterium]|nr:chromosomal replication initiator protein DnaA [Polyangiaceae bacterium]